LTIVVDPGHGGDDKGAIGSTGLDEKEVNLSVSRLLAGALRRRGAEVRLLRDGDSTVPLNARYRGSVGAEPDLFVSIHSNSIAVAADPMASQGTTTYFARPHSEPLARAISRRLSALEQVEDNGVETENFRVIRQPHFPAVLVENLFLSHPGDEERLLSREWRQRLAEAIARGIEDFCQDSR
jgi:N-acetylmuramoyl-L-alanine amidase